MSSELTLLPGLRQGSVTVPASKSHLHRLMIAEFLAGQQGGSPRKFQAVPDTSAEDIRATAACLDSLQTSETPSLPCRESGSTLRFLLPVAMACRGEAYFTAEGRLPLRPITPFLSLLAAHNVRCLSPEENLFPLHLQGKLQPGRFTLPGNISSQIVTGLLFALPILSGESQIQLTSPMESRGYVEMTLQILRQCQIQIEERENGYRIPGSQKYHLPVEITPETDWSGASFWLAMNFLGSRITLPTMQEDSRQPDRQMPFLLQKLGKILDVSQSPDLFPPLAAAAGAIDADTVFTGVRRLRMKESDRLAAMAELLQAFGVATTNEENRFTVHGIGPRLRGEITISPHNDHRIAMAAAVAATVANGPVKILEPDCIRKSYPDFFRQFQQLKPLCSPAEPNFPGIG